jgi:heme/copper-type cytochrome/quinol oxidase subunit 4
MDPVGNERPVWRYLASLLVLLALTACELAVARLSGVPATRAARVTALAGLAMLKATVVLAFFMELKGAGRGLKRVALLPIVVAPPIAVVFMLEAAWRASQR